MSKKLVVVDDALSEEDKDSVFSLLHNKGESLTGMWIPKGDLPDCLDKIAQHGAAQFDLSKATGFELWTHQNTRPHVWHYDHDEHERMTTEYIRFPICSIVYYPFVGKLEGGNFRTETVIVTPRTNRLITFSPGVLHGVEEYVGERFAVLLNPWIYPPKDVL